jgi:hypothetical protein
VAQLPDINNLKVELFILLVVSEDLVHYGREGMVEQGNSHHSSQEAERGDVGRGQGKLQPSRTCPQ